MRELFEIVEGLIAALTRLSTFVENSLHDRSAVAHLQKLDLSAGALLINPTHNGDFLAVVFGGIGDVKACLFIGSRFAQHSGKEINWSFVEAQILDLFALIPVGIGINADGLKKKDRMEALRYGVHKSKLSIRG